MSDTLTILINDQVVYECNREKDLDEKRLEFFDKMDNDMDHGVKISGKLFKNPDIERRAQFVSMNLVNALRHDDQAKISALCAYLGHRLPKVIQVHIKDQDDSVVVEFVDEPPLP